MSNNIGAESVIVAQREVTRVETVTDADGVEYEKPVTNVEPLMLLVVLADLTDRIAKLEARHTRRKKATDEDPGA